MQRSEAIGSRARDRRFQRLAPGADRLRIGGGDLLGDIGFGGKHHQLAAHQVIEGGIGDRRGHRLDDRRLAGNIGAGEMAQHQALHRLIAGEGIIVVRGEKQQVFAGGVGGDRHRR